jgi:hypothetical protein
MQITICLVTIGIEKYLDQKLNSCYCEKFIIENSDINADMIVNTITVNF